MLCKGFKCLVDGVIFEFGVLVDIEVGCVVVVIGIWFWFLVLYFEGLLCIGILYLVELGYDDFVLWFWFCDVLIFGFDDVGLVFNVLKGVDLLMLYFVLGLGFCY